MDTLDSQCSQTVCLFSCPPGCLMSLKFGNTTVIKTLPTYLRGRGAGGFPEVPVFPQKERGERWEGEEAVGGKHSINEFSPWLSDLILNFIWKAFYKICKSLLDALLYSLTLNWYNASVTTSTKWITSISSFTYIIII